MNKRIGVYPGTFDPITYGHIDIVTRALNVVDTLIVAVAVSNVKTPIFTAEERVEMAMRDLEFLNSKTERVQVKAFEGLLVDFANKERSNLIIRGLRAVSDFEYEFQMACMNSHLGPDIQTIFLPASEKNQFIASRLVKEIARLGGDVSGFASENVKNALNAKLKKA